jgi:hypothetical protein
MRQDKDRSSKWLIAQAAGSILKLAGFSGFTSWKHLSSEVVAPRRLLDGLIELRYPDRPEPALVLIEIESYPDADVDRQVFDDLALVWLEHRRVPDVVSLILKPKGHLQANGTAEQVSPTGSTRIGGSWPVIQLWDIPAEQLLDDGDVGLIPWVPLTRSDAPPDQLLGRCVERINTVTDDARRGALLAVTEIFAGLAFPGRRFANLFGGPTTMIESPVLDEAFALVEARSTRSNIAEILDSRFGNIPPELTGRLLAVADQQRLKALVRFAAKCPDLPAFLDELAKD